MKLIDRLKTEHRAKLENLEYAHVKESIIKALENEYVFEMTIGAALNFCNCILNKPLDYITLHDYFKKKKIMKDTIIYKGFEFQYDVTYYPAEEETNTYAGIDVENITLNGIDASGLLETQITEFENFIWEQKYE